MSKLLTNSFIIRNGCCIGLMVVLSIMCTSTYGQDTYTTVFSDTLSTAAGAVEENWKGGAPYDASGGSSTSVGWNLTGEYFNGKYADNGSLIWGGATVDLRENGLSFPYLTEGGSATGSISFTANNGGSDWSWEDALGTTSDGGRKYKISWTATSTTGAEALTFNMSDTINTGHYNGWSKSLQDFAISTYGSAATNTPNSGDNFGANIDTTLRWGQDGESIVDAKNTLAGATPDVGGQITYELVVTEEAYNEEKGVYAATVDLTVKGFHSNGDEVVLDVDLLPHIEDSLDVSVNTTNYEFEFEGEERYFTFGLRNGYIGNLSDFTIETMGTSAIPESSSVALIMVFAVANILLIRRRPAL